LLAADLFPAQLIRERFTTLAVEGTDPIYNIFDEEKQGPSVMQKPEALQNNINLTKINKLYRIVFH